jgi:hypothetical protein
MENPYQQTYSFSIVWMILLIAFSVLLIAQTSFIIIISKNKETIDKITFLNNNTKNQINNHLFSSVHIKIDSVTLHYKDTSLTFFRQDPMAVKQYDDNITKSEFLYSNQRIVLYLFSLLLNMIAIIYSGYKLSKARNSVVHSFNHRKIISDLIEEISNNSNTNVSEEIPENSNNEHPEIKLSQAEFRKKQLEKQLVEITSTEEQSHIKSELTTLELKEIIPLKFEVENLKSQREEKKQQREREKQERDEKLKNLNKLIEKEISLLNPIDECSKSTSFLNQLFDSKE